MSAEETTLHEKLSVHDAEFTEDELRDLRVILDIYSKTKVVFGAIGWMGDHIKSLALWIVAIAAVAQLIFGQWRGE